MAGYQVGEACYSSIESAVGAMAANLTGQVHEVGGYPYLLQATVQLPSSLQIDAQQLNGHGTFTKTIAVTPEPCNLLGFQEGLELGWLVAAVWIAAFSLTFLKKAIIK